MPHPTLKWWTGPDRGIYSVLFALLALCFGFGLVIIGWLTPDDDAQRWFAIPLALVVAGSLASVCMSWASWMTSKLGGRRFGRALDSAARSRILPKSADADWNPFMARYERIVSRERRLAPIVMGVVGLGAVFATVGGMVESPPWQYYAAAIMGPAASIFLPIDAQRRLNGIRIIRAELDERLSTTAAS